MRIIEQLHEQYAVNNNASLNSIVMLITAFIASFGGYGYVFLHSSAEYDFVMLINNGYYSIDAVFLTSMALIFVMTIIKSICAYQGIAQRREQFIIYKIRQAMSECKSCKLQNILPKNYTPFGKTKVDVVQGLYGEFIGIMDKSIILIIASLLIKIFQNVNKHCCSGSFSYHAVFLILVFIIFLILICCCYENYFDKQYERYRERESEYKSAN